MKNENDIFQTMQDDINRSDVDETTKRKLFQNVLNLKDKKINLMITGATGAGKSSTINALFKTEVAKVGTGVNPETMDIKKYELDNLILWDSPGLGDGKEKDIQHSKGIIDKLYEKDSDGNLLIDLVLVIVDGSTRDLGTSYELINSVIIPNLGKDVDTRLLVAMNQADVAMRGRNPWDHENNKPTPQSKKFLDDKIISIKRRIREATNASIEPIYYSAGYKEEGEKQRPYNLSKLLYFIVSNTPTEKRLGFIKNISNDNEMWKDSDEIIDYNREIKKSFAETIVESATKGADIGGSIGKIFGGTGEAIGRVAGGVIGAIGGAISSVASSIGSFFSW